MSTRPDEIDENKLSPFHFQQFDSNSSIDIEAAPSEPQIEAELNVRIELGRTELDQEELALLQLGTVVRLNQTGDDPVDILVDERLIGRGEVLVLDGRFCVRLVELLTLEF